MIFFILTISLISQTSLSKDTIPADSSSVGDFKPYFKDSSMNISPIEELYRQDSLLISKGEFKESELTEDRLIEIIKGDNNYVNSALANKYLKSGIKDLNKGRTEKGKRKIEFSRELDPLNRHIPLTMAKSAFPNCTETTKYLWHYILTVKSLNNKVFFIKTLLLFLILFSFCIILSTVGASVVFFISYITKWLEGKIDISGLWIGAILLALFVWLPIQIVFLLLVAISLLKMNKPNLIRCAVILFILPFLISYSYIISSNFSPGTSVYREYRTRFNPNAYKFDSPVTPYGYSIKGIEAAKRGSFAEAKDLFEKGYSIRKDLNYLENLCSVYYAEGDTVKSIDMCENILSNDPKNEIANITIIKIHLDKLNFNEATNQMAKSGLELLEISKKELPVYSYPTERWLYKYIFVPRGLFKYLANNNLYIMFIIGICMITMVFHKREEEKYCPICNNFMLTVKSEENMCIQCIKKLSLTKSKSIRERLKRRIKIKSFRVDKITDLLMNLIIPGSAHFYKKKYIAGIIISFFAAVLLLIFLHSLLLQVQESLQYRTYIGKNIFIISVILFYLVLMFLSWRLKPHGNGR